MLGFVLRGKSLSEDETPVSAREALLLPSRDARSCCDDDRRSCRSASAFANDVPLTSRNTCTCTCLLSLPHVSTFSEAMFARLMPFACLHTSGRRERDSEEEQHPDFDPWMRTSTAERQSPEMHGASDGCSARSLASRSEISNRRCC